MLLSECECVPFVFRSLLSFCSLISPILHANTYPSRPWLGNNPTEDYAGQTAITNSLLPQLKNLTRGGGAYLNEGDIHQPNWQYVFYNVVYQRLLSTKREL
jgi:hypothetical protein